MLNIEKVALCGQILLRSTPMNFRLTHPVIHVARREAAGIPTAAAGLALGVASLGWALDNALSTGGAAQSAGAIIAAVLLSGVAGKFLLHPSLLRNDLTHPVACSILPTFAMGTMVISKAVGRYAPGLAEGMWLAAVALHLVLMVLFAWHHLKKCDLGSMVPSWFIPPVGIITAALTFPGPHLAPLAEFCLFLGVVNYAAMLPVMLYRLIFHPEIADAVKPTIAVMAAPASLSLAGYLSVTAQPSLVLTTLLLGIALLMTIVIYLALVRLLRLPFSPAYASFTFPLVISSTALFKATDLFASSPGAEHYAAALHGMASAELFVAILVVGYVLCLFAAAGGQAMAAAWPCGLRKVGALVPALAPREK